MDMAGHVSKQMLKHYSHIRMKAKSTAVDSLVKKTKVDAVLETVPKDSPKVERLN